jgi:hypothetical protein
MSNQTLANAMQSGIDSGAFERKKGYCQRANRQAIQRVYGNRYNHLMKGSARETAFAMLAAGVAFRASELKARGGLQVGDILFKTYRPHGHVEIYLGNGRTGGNSSTSLGRVNGALGYRTLAHFGSVDIVGRLPDPHVKTTSQRALDEGEIIVSVWDGSKWQDHRIDSIEKANTNFVGAQELLRLAKVNFDLSKWGDGTPNIRIVGAP